ncbi:MAG: hypothetical protein Q9M94_03030 [Candidatus Gracilibacteria bacterium]|nr:hypothetical protein [Candidatus Gracilibacteria bacterium]MDQ7023573.1 hypothetical protein [Candidatus Gracilibacteria bacterium]
MAIIDITEKEVDKIILELLEKHSPRVAVVPKDFLDLLRHSLSLNTMEKKRVVDASPTLSQFQWDELTKVFTEERVKFRDLAKEHPDDIKKLLKKQQSEWIQLGDLYKSENANKEKQKGEQSKIDDIKAQLGL